MDGDEGPVQRRTRRWDTPRGEVIARVALALLLVAVASIAASGLAFGLGVQRVSMIYLVAVLISAAWLGTTYGILTAVAATVAFNFLFGPPAPFQLALGTRQDIVNLIVFVGSAWVVGVYADELRRGYEALGRLTRVKPQADRAPAASHDGIVWRREATRLLAAITITLASAAIAGFAFEQLHLPGVSMIYLAGVVVSAMLLGTRFGLMTAITSVFALDFLAVEPRFTLQLDSFQAGANLVVFAGMAWTVGVFAEQVRYERQAVRSLFTAGRSLSATAEEPALRAILCDAVAAATAGGAVVVRDETGAVSARCGEAPDGKPAPDIHAGGEVVSDWRVRPLLVEGRELGSVAWHAPPRWARPNVPVDRTVNVLVDIGAAAIARARLSADNARMEVNAQTDELRRALLASVSHDVRTPLSGILGASTSLLDYADRYDGAVKRDLLMTIREQALRLTRYVENLLGMTRLEAGALQPRLQPVELEALVFDTWESIAEIAEGRPPPAIHVPAGLRASADPALLRQALTNVLDNAVKYGPRDGQITVEAKSTAKKVELVVTDEGPGISEDDLAHIFQPFARGAGEQAGGFGLGLYITRSFMEAMGGAIIAQQRRDGRAGLAVRLVMPKASEGT